MYCDFFGLSEPPFELTPNPRFLYLPPQHEEALSALQYAFAYRKGLMVLTGEAGMGKTTLVQAALARLDRRTSRTIVVKNPALTRTEFLETVARAFGLDDPREISKPVLLEQLEATLKRERQQDVTVVLIADEAHVMPTELLEEIRLLGNIETVSEKLISIVLVGQPELATRLNDPSLRQLKQRVAVRCALAPLTLRDTSAYILTRLRAAGNAGTPLFTREAVQLIHAKSRGIPRLISVICDNALVTAFATGHKMVDSPIVAEVARDFDLNLETETPPPAAAADPTAATAPVAEPDTVPAGPVAAVAPAVGAAAQARGAMAADSMFGGYTRPRTSFLARVFSR